LWQAVKLSLCCTCIANAAVVVPYAVQRTDTSAAGDGTAASAVSCGCNALVQALQNLLLASRLMLPKELQQSTTAVAAVDFKCCSHLSSLISCQVVLLRGTNPWQMAQKNKLVLPPLLPEQPALDSCKLVLHLPPTQGTACIQNNKLVLLPAQQLLALLPQQPAPVSCQLVLLPPALDRLRQRHQQRARPAAKAQQYMHA
jgi:hypothetical protein